MGCGMWMDGRNRNYHTYQAHHQFTRIHCTMVRRRDILLLLASANLANSQGNIPPQAKPDEPLGNVLHQVLDSNKDTKVTMAEVSQQLSILDLLFSQGAAGEAGKVDEKNRANKEMLEGLKFIAPTLFKLLDSNSDEKLTKKELEYVTKFEKSLMKGGGMRDLLRDVFGVLDTDKDDKLSADELFSASQSDKVISDVTVLFHKLFPLRDTAAELEVFVKTTIESIGGKGAIDKESIIKGMKWIDEDEDGQITRQEVGKAYNSAGKQFMSISKTIKVMGPLFAMMGGSGGMGGAGGPGGFKMDL
eukprot:scaffold248391_cov70-Cyclotella_meneghiniana.AAC.15